MPIDIGDDIDDKLTKLADNVSKLVTHERNRLLNESNFLNSVRASYDAASANTKDAEVAKVLGDIDKFLSAG